jgi:hypothetical protein
MRILWVDEAGGTRPARELESAQEEHQAIQRQGKKEEGLL